jgi:hypothetical protein
MLSNWCKRCWITAMMTLPRSETLNTETESTSVFDQLQQNSCYEICGFRDTR